MFEEEKGGPRVEDWGSKEDRVSKIGVRGVEVRGRRMIEVRGGRNIKIRESRFEEGGLSGFEDRGSRMEEDRGSQRPKKPPRRIPRNPDGHPGFRCPKAQAQWRKGPKTIR